MAQSVFAICYIFKHHNKMIKFYGRTEIESYPQINNLSDSTWKLWIPKVSSV